MKLDSSCMQEQVCRRPTLTSDFSSQSQYVTNGLGLTLKLYLNRIMFKHPQGPRHVLRETKRIAIQYSSLTDQSDKSLPSALLLTTFGRKVNLCQEFECFVGAESSANE
jgi:hypothetical protein